MLLNLYAGDAALVLLLGVVTALVMAKISILIGRPLGPFALWLAVRFGNRRFACKLFLLSLRKQVR